MWFKLAYKCSISLYSLRLGLYGHCLACTVSQLLPNDNQRRLVLMSLFSYMYYMCVFHWIYCFESFVSMHAGHHVVSFNEYDLVSKDYSPAHYSFITTAQCWNGMVGDRMCINVTVLHYHGNFRIKAIHVQGISTMQRAQARQVTLDMIETSFTGNITI